MVKLVSFVSGLFKSRKAEVAVADPMRIHISHNHDADRTGNRIGIAMIAFTVFCVVVGGRLVQYGVRSPETVSSILPSDRLLASRPDLHDRNGSILATDIRTVSLYAEPHKISDPDEVIEQLALVLPDLDVKKTYRKLSSKSRFQWLRRQLTPGQQSEILTKGIPGIGFRPEKRRFYPGGPTASHVVGHVNIDNVGIAGMEKFVDGQGFGELAAVGLTVDKALEPVALSIDLRVQHILRDELSAAMERYRAIATAGVVLDVHTGEVIAMSSLPDYDPNNPVDALKTDRLNRMTGGTFEMVLMHESQFVLADLRSEISTAKIVFCLFQKSSFIHRILAQQKWLMLLVSKAIKSF
jgi:cell division protein FtsI (penicillin-binding protein 3)